jgi:hypothetical protein
MTFPSFCKDKEFKNLMTLMLNKNPLSRMIKLAQIKNHIWFMDFSWENLISLNLEPPHMPKIPKEGKITPIAYVNYVNVWLIFLFF